MIDANKTSLENGENAFDAIRCHVAAHIFARTVIDGLVRNTRDVAIDRRFVGVDRCARFNIGRVRAYRGQASCRSCRHRRCRAYWRAFSLRDRRCTVHQFRRCRATFRDWSRKPRAVKDEPSRLLRDADLLGQLQAGNALARRQRQIHRVNPLMQRNMRALENRVGADREVLFALIAAVIVILARGDSLAQPTDGAARTVRPKANPLSRNYF
jgi:hypothetical protein